MREELTFVLVSGARDYADRNWVWQCLDAMLFLHGDLYVITGSCPTGADLFAEQWAKDRQQIYMGLPAEWSRYGRSAGVKRNEEMLRITRPQHVIVFAGGPGSRDMLRRSQKALKAGKIESLWTPDGEDF